MEIKIEDINSVINAEMLEALQDTLALLVNGNKCDDDPDRIIAQARAVIAKAGGGIVSTKPTLSKNLY